MATTNNRQKTPAKKQGKAAAQPVAEPTHARPAGAAATAVTGGALPADPQDLHDAIARRAYEIYEANGRPEGRDAEHWAQAEREIRAVRLGR